jgi:hypothetical protein
MENGKVLQRCKNGRRLGVLQMSKGRWEGWNAFADIRGSLETGRFLQECRRV